MASSRLSNWLERHRVAERRTFLDQPMNQRARGQDFQLDLSAQCVVAVTQRRILVVDRLATGAFR